MIEFSVAFMKHGLIERYIMKNGKTILMMKFMIIDSWRWNSDFRHRGFSFQKMKRGQNKKNTITHVYSFHPRKLPHHYNTIIRIHNQCFKQTFIKNIKINLITFSPDIISVGDIMIDCAVLDSKIYYSAYLAAFTKMNTKKPISYICHSI